MNSNVSKCESISKCSPFHHRFSAFCRAIPSLLAIISLLSVIQNAKASLFVPPHLVPSAPFANAIFPLQNVHFYRVIVHPPPLHFSAPSSAASPRLQPSPLPLRSFELSSPKTWRVVLGEICQLPNFLRPTENSSTFAECEQLDWGIAELLNRSDLGVWRLRFCEKETLFVPSSQRCLSRRSVLLQNEICSKKALRRSNDGGTETFWPNETNELDANFSLCPPGDSSDLWMTVKRKVPSRQKWAEEKTPEGKTWQLAKEEEEEEEGESWDEEGRESAEEDSTKTDEVQLVEPCEIRIGDDKGKTMHRQLAKCPCDKDNCICLESRLPRLFSACCCATKQTSPCQCPVVSPNFVTVDDKSLSVDQSAKEKPKGLAPQWPSQHNSNKLLEKEEDNLVGPSEGFVPMPAGVEQPRHCPLIDQTMPRIAQYQGMCSWMLDPLVADSESRTHFLQCQPAPFSLFCGRWQRMPCAPKTVFDGKEQMCIWEDNQQQRGEERENEIFPYSIGKSEQQQKERQCVCSTFPFAPFFGLRCPSSPRGQ